MTPPPPPPPPRSRVAGIIRQHLTVLYDIEWFFVVYWQLVF